MTGGDADALRAALHARSGFAADAVSPERLHALLSMRASELRLADAGDAARLALRDPAEFARIEAHFAPPETWLFRYPESFELVREIAAARGARGVRALVLGAGGWCEPCAMVAALREGAALRGGAALREGLANIEVEASDRNPALFAAAPLFAGPHLRAPLPAWAERHFVRASDALQPTPELLGCIRTRVEDAATATARLAAAGARFDVVSFRNVAIYLHAEARRAVFGSLAALLADGGVLLVGHAELATAVALSGLEPDPVHGAFALRRRAAVAGGAPQAGGSSGSTVAQTRSLSSGSASVSSPASSPSAPSPVTRSASLQPPSPAPRVPIDPVAALRADLAARPTDLGLHLRLAALLLERRDVLGASESVARALYLEPHDEHALLLAARIADERGATADADRYRQRALRAHLARMQRDGDA